jgi:hypothetical protein
LSRSRFIRGALPFVPSAAPFPGSSTDGRHRGGGVQAAGQRIAATRSEEGCLSYLAQFQPTTCACVVCQAMCERKPCWPTPREVVRLIRAGHGGKLMLDRWEDDDELPFTQIVCPAEIASEGRIALHAGGVCTFFVDRRCQIHSLKPIEGRLASCVPKYKGFRLHLEVAKSWNTASGRRVVNFWSERFCR